MSSVVTSDLMKVTAPLQGSTEGSRLRRRVRFLIRSLFIMGLFFSGNLWWAQRQLRRRGSILVLTLHRVLPDNDFEYTHSHYGMVLRESTFRALAEHIATKHQIVDVKQAKPGGVDSKLRIALTFDDGWEDNYRVALPIAREHGLPMTIFLCPGLMGKEAPFWPEQVARLLNGSGSSTEVSGYVEKLKRLSPDERDPILEELARERRTTAGSVIAADRTMSWDEASRMLPAGVTFGSHTQTHQIVTTIPGVTIREEVQKSKASLESALPVRCDLFAYPNGNHNPESEKILREESYRYAFTNSAGIWTEDSDPMAIPRVNVHEGKLVGMRGRFSSVLFDYAVVWKAWRAQAARGGAAS